MRTVSTLAAPAETEKSGDVTEITELEKFEPDRMDGVGKPANGFPVLMMKGIGEPRPEPREMPYPLGSLPEPKKTTKTRAAGALSKSERAKAVDTVVKLLAGELPAVLLEKDAPGFDESADIAGAIATIKQIAALIVSEATELGNGRLEEVCDIETLIQAVYAMKCFLRSEQAQDSADGAGPGAVAVDDAGINGAVSYEYKSAKSVYAKLHKSAPEGELWPDGTLRKFVSAGQRKQYADSGVAMPNGDFPIPDKGHLKSAVGHYGGYKGDKAAAKKHIIKRAKALGLTSLLPDDWTGGGGGKANKGAILTMKSLQDSGALLTPDAINKAVTEALSAASEERFNAFEARLMAKVNAAPIPGGPFIVTSHTKRPGVPAGVEKAEHYRAVAAQTSDPDVKRSYLDLAARAEGQVPKESTT